MRKLDRTRSYGKIIGRDSYRGVMVVYEQDYLKFDASGECIDDMFDKEPESTELTVDTDMKIIRALAKEKDIKTFGKTKTQIIDELNA